MNIEPQQCSALLFVLVLPFVLCEVECAAAPKVDERPGE